MANTNTTTNLIDTLLAQGLLALREQAIMPRLVNRGYERTPGEKYSSIDVSIPSAITAQAVSPSNTPPDDAGISPTKVTLTLDQWYEAPFFLNDKELLEVQSGTIPMQASEAIKALANNVDNAILALYTGFYGFAGVPGTTPFANDLSEYLSARRALNASPQLAPMDPRYCVIDPDAEANAMGLRQFTDASFRGDTEGIVRGQIGDKLGARWGMDQNIPTHTTGAAGTPLVDDASAVAAGVTQIHMDGLTTKPSVGDIFTIAGDTQTYVVTASTALAGTDSDVSFQPPLQVALPTGDNNEVVTFKASHVANLLLHRDAIALATRPFQGADPLGLGMFRSAVDPISGLALRLEVSRQHKRTRFSFDILYGVMLARRELGARIAG